MSILYIVRQTALLAKSNVFSTTTANPGIPDIIASQIVSRFVSASPAAIAIHEVKLASIESHIKKCASLKSQYSYRPLFLMSFCSSFLKD
jgi:hypothetical protein